MKIFYLLIIATFLINPLYSENLTNKECNEVASEINSSMGGMKIDQMTILTSAICPTDANFLYNYKVTSDISSEIFREAMPELKTININSWCSDPNLNELLSMLDSVGFRYSTNNGIYLGEFKIDKSLCY